MIEPLVTIGAPPSAAETRGERLPARLRDGYGSDLPIRLRADRPTVIANFVSTIDGVVSYNTAEAAGGGEVSGFFEPDAFVMGLLRSLADCVLIGAGTLRAAPDQMWTPRFTHPVSAGDFAALREQLALAHEPSTVVVTASGRIDLAHKGLADPAVPVLVITTNNGLRSLRAQRTRGANVEVISAGTDQVPPRAVLDLLGQRGMRLVLCEGGPHLLGQLVAERLVDELFLTLAPQIAGRSPDTHRLQLIEGAAFTVAEAPWARLVDLRRQGSHLFTRYSFRQAGA